MNILKTLPWYFIKNIVHKNSKRLANKRNRICSIRIHVSELGIEKVKLQLWKIGCVQCTACTKDQERTTKHIAGVDRIHASVSINRRHLWRCRTFHVTCSQNSDNVFTEFRNYTQTRIRILHFFLFGKKSNFLPNTKRFLICRKYFQCEYKILIEGRRSL